MKRRKSILRVITFGIGGLVLLLCFYLLLAVFLPKIAIEGDRQTELEHPVTIFIKTNGVHTDIVVPVVTAEKDWRTMMRYADTDLGDTSLPYVSVGWGDKGFYLQTPSWSDLKFSVAFKAMFHLGTSAIHATFVKHVQTGPNCIALNLSIEQYQGLVQYIEKSFVRDSFGRTIVIPSKNDGYGQNDAFYESPYVYDLFHTCNTWANAALKSCGQRACLWTATDKGIFELYRK
jgi:uncharacterized protein (TIGR02117 family)